MRSLIIVMLLLLPSSAIGQERFAWLHFLIGHWQGVETGVSGDGIGFRTYTYELGENYIVEKNQSTFPISDQNPRGEVHRDFGVFSFNSNKNKIVYRSFNIEGFTNVFELDPTSKESKLVFVSREIENNPGKWKVRVTIEKISDSEFCESFEIAMDGETFKSFLQNHWERTK